MEKNECPCKRKGCARYGNCAECRAHHNDKKHPPYCERNDAKKRCTPDRKTERKA